jgi:hypothetical protein
VHKLVDINYKNIHGMNSIKIDESEDYTASRAIWKAISAKINSFIVGKRAFSYGNVKDIARSGRPTSRTVTWAAVVAFAEQSVHKSARKLSAFDHV